VSFNQFSLDARLLTTLRQLRFQQPTPIQAATLPPALAGEDILGSAETGTGKTAAYLLPSLHRLLTTEARTRHPRALIVAPTRELALQIEAHAKQLSRLTHLKTVAIYGGVGLGQQAHLLRQGADVVVATPGRLLDHVERNHLAFGALEVLVLDEADRMLDVGFLPDLRRIVKLLPHERQTMLFSATLVPSIMSLAREVTRQARRIQIETATPPAAIAQAFYLVAEPQKAEVLQTLLRADDMESVLVFARTKHRADRLVKQLRGTGIHASVIHGNRTQGQRTAALEAFRRGHARVLVATDIAARGLDVAGVSHVINYDVPVQLEDYVHRIGRTGRAQAMGSAYTLVTPTDELMVRKIETQLQQRIERRRLAGASYQVVPPPPTHPPVTHSARSWGKQNFQRRRALPLRHGV
jgi:ATP-dependent RNA helicase RhlE